MSDPRDPRPGAVGQHTPGPWAWDSRNGTTYLVAPDVAISVARLDVPPDLCGRADMALIAAAPDLLAALKECSFRLATLILASGDFSDINAKTLDAALAAIARAESPREGTQMADMKDGGPAFPESVSADLDGGLNFSRHPGMSIRDHFAGQALISMVTELHMPPTISEPEWATTAASNAYKLADAMLKAREKGT